VLDIYARLNLIRTNKSGGDNYIDQNLEELMKMAKREKFTDYRDVIYFTAAQMELERKNPAAAEAYLLKAAKYSNNNNVSRNRSYLQLADLTYSQKKYLLAASYYDSLEMSGISPEDVDRVTARKAGLIKVVAALTKINHQDSLQRIAGMPEEERNDYLKKLARQLRRQRGLKEEESFSGGGAPATEEVYSTQTKGDWYFYNPVLKKQGAATFRRVWGNRPNVDNWRRASDVSSQLRTNVAATDAGRNADSATTGLTTAGTSYDELIANLPLTPEKIKISNEVIRTSLLALGTSYMNDIEDYSSAIQTFEELKRRFPDYPGMNEVLFNLQYAYSKTGDAAKASEAKNLLLKNYPASRQASILNTGVDPAANKPATDVTRVYENIYDQFIEGNFEGAIAAKQNADSVYKTNYWSPQLLYIEAVYHVKQREDSLAKNTLNLLIQQNPNTPLADKAANMIQVLARRNQIEEELRNLNIIRPQEDTIVVQEYTPAPTAIKRDNGVVQKDNVVVNGPVAIKQRSDTGLSKTFIPPPSVNFYTYDANAKHFVVIVLNKVDNVFGNEAKNAFTRYNKERYYNLTLTNEIVPLDADNKLLLVGGFSNILQATEYLQKVMPLAPKEIVPWLKADKYSFTIISNPNLEVLKTKPDLNTYKAFLEKNSGLKF
jgi:outer membrane protein assembly factor BamD (BamD/ComL family)